MKGAAKPKRRCSVLELRAKMRAILLAAIVLGIAFAGVAMTPEASACTGDPSVCGIKKSTDCTLREGVSTDVLDDCWRWL